MSSKYPILKPNDIISALSKKGFVYKSQKGSHAKYSNGHRIVIIPIHDCSKRNIKKYITSSRNRVRKFLGIIINILPSA